MFATQPQRVLTDVSANPSRRHFAAQGVASSLAATEVKYSRVWASTRLILHSKLETGLQLVLENKTDLPSTDKLLCGSESLDSSNKNKIKQETQCLHTPPPTAPSLILSEARLSQQQQNLAT